MSRVLSDAEAWATIAPDGQPPAAPDTGVPLVANREKLEQRLGRPLPPELFTFHPWGHRIVVTRDEPLRKIGGIHVPDSAQVPPARGTVVSVGPLVGLGRSDYVGHCPFPPERLLGARVLFGAYAGQSLRLDPRDDDYNTYTVVLTENEVWGLVGEPPEEDLR